MNEPDFIQPRPFTSPPRAPDPAGGKRPPFNFLQLIIAIAAVGMLAGLGIMVLGPSDKTPSPPAPASPPPAATPAQPPVKPEPVKPASTTPAAPEKLPAVEAAASTSPAPPAPSALSPEAQEQARKDADAAMSDLLDVRRKLDAMAPSAWGGDTWSNAVAEAAQGDTAYMAKDFDTATRRFRAAARAMQEVESAAPLAFDQLMGEGGAAIARGDTEAATRLLNAALSIRPGDAAAAKLLARANTAAEVKGHLRNGAEQEAAGQVELAYAAYGEALRLDPAFPGAAEAHERVRGQLGTSVLKKLMSAGLADYREGRLEDARAKFLEAKKIRPELPEIDDALRLVEDGMRLRRLEALRDAALAAEAKEDFEPALKLHNEALAIDPAVAFAKEGRERCILGIRMARQLDAYLSQPESLFKEATLREASATLEEARAVPAPGPKLKGRIEALAAAITAAITPVDVSVVSDGKTEVTLLRSGALGQFDRKTIQLKPGNHVITGSRDGYRDVRVDVQVRPGKAVPAVDVTCREKI